MRKGLFLVLVGLLFDSSAATYYVSTSGRSGAAGTEADPCSVIQDAVAKAVSGDTVIVAPGVYNTGGVSNVYARVSITNAITLKSSHGPAVTVIEGSGTEYYGTTSARRGVYMTTGVVDGFTIRKGATSGTLVVPAYSSRGGAVLYDKTPVDNVVRVKNCIIKDNKAFIGAGVYGTVTVGNCAFSGNVNGADGTVGWSGFYITAINCFFDASGSVLGYALAGDATTRAYAMNCVFTANGAIRPLTYTTVYYSCTPFVDGIGTVNGGGNIITNNPKINTSTWRPYTNSACLNAGGITWNSASIASLLSTDMNGNCRTNGNCDIGPVEWQIYKTTNVTASVNSQASVVVRWTAAEPDVSIYNIYRSVNHSLSQASRIAKNITPTGSSMSYTDFTAGYRTNYYYWVQATNTIVNTSASFSAHSFSSSDSGVRLMLTNTIPLFSVSRCRVFTNSISVWVYGTNIYYWKGEGAEAYSATKVSVVVTNNIRLTAQSRSFEKWNSPVATTDLYRAYQLLVNGMAGYYTNGTSIQQIAPLYPGYSFSGWTGVTNSGSSTVSFSMPTDNARLDSRYSISRWSFYTTGTTSGVVLSWFSGAFSNSTVYTVLRSSGTNFSEAGVCGQSAGTNYLDATSAYKTTYYYWLLVTNKSSVVNGPYLNPSVSASITGMRLTLTNTTPIFSVPESYVFTNSVSLSVSGTNIYYRLNDEAEMYSATNFALFVSSDAVLTAQSRSSDKWDSGITTAKLYRAYQLMVNNQTNYLIAGIVTNITAREIANRPFVGWSGYTNSTERTIILTMPPQDVELAAVYEPAVGQVGSVSVSSDADRILLEWSGIPGTLLYEIQRGDSIEGAFASVAQTDLTFYQDTTAVPGRTYYYKVRAFAVSQIDEEQAGAFSEVVSGMRPALLEVVASGFVQPLPSSAGDCSLSVAANMEWTAISRAPWMTVKSVTTEGAVFAILSNSDTTNSRTGVIRFILGEGVLTNDYSVTQSGNRRPDQPVGISPSGTSVDPFNVLLTASPYSDAEGDAQSNTEWRVNGVVTANPIERLAYATDCVWQVRYQDPYSWSDWSTALSFTTLVPELSLSLAATNAPKEGLVFDFTVTSNCQWEVAVDVDWLAYVRTANQVSVTVERNTGDARTGTLRIHPLGTNGWMQTVTVAQAEWPIPPAPIQLLPTDNAVVTGSVQLVLQTVGGISNTEWRINGQLTNSVSDAARFTNAVLIQRGVTNFWSARFTDGVRWSASSPTNRFYWMKKDTVYVSTNGNDSADGESWEHAFRTIQKGIDSAPIGGTVLVGNGVYNTGGGFLSGLEAVVLLTNSVTLRSVGGADKTIIQARMNGGFGRCVYVKTNSVMEGFTLTGGRTMSVSDSSGRGGAIYSENNLQSSFGSCIISNNSAQNGIVYQDLGGYLTFESCLFSGNSSAGFLVGRLPINRFYNCTLVRNSVVALLNNAMLYNTLVVSNTANTIASLSGSSNSIGVFPVVQFVGYANNNFRLLPTAVSCIDKGTTNFLPYVLGQTDLEGKPRIQGRRIDIGAYEATPPPPTILRIF